MLSIDLLVLHPREDDYAAEHPGPQDALLSIEVADATADYDREAKIPAYARAGIAEAWLLDLSADCLEAYREPSPAGYRLLRKALPGETVSPLACPDVILALDDIIR